MGRLEEVAGEPLRIAIFSPAPPERSGIADYVADLVSIMPPAWEIEIFCDDDGGPRVIADRAPCKPHHLWEGEHARRPFDLNLYQVGNNVAHAYALPYVQRTPGLLTLHDAIVHPSRALATLGRRDPGGYRATAQRCRADIGGDLAHLAAAGLAGPALFWRFPMAEDLVRASRLTVVHGVMLAAWLSAVTGNDNVRSVVHWRRVPDAPSETIAQWRAQRSPDEVPLLGTFGHIGRAHRMHVVLDGLARLATRYEFRFAVVGTVSSGLGLEDRARELGLADRVEWLGGVPPKEFGAALRAVDIGVNLRYPTARSSSGTLQQLLVAGKPVVVSDLIHLRDIPEDCVARVPPAGGSGEAELLAAAIEPWLADPTARERAGMAAGVWAGRTITPEAMAESYVAAVAHALGRRVAA